MEASSDRVNTPAENIPSAQGHTVSASLDFDAAMGGALEDGKRKADEWKAGQLQKCDEAESKAARIRRENPDIVKRARELHMAGVIQFPNTKKVRVGDSFVAQPEMTDRNKVAILNALFEGEEAAPHRDHFLGRIVDHEGRIVDEFYPVTRWIEAFDKAGLKGVPLKVAREILKEYALDHERNDLIRYVESKLPKWDRKPRMESKLIDLFQCRETPLNRLIGKYFWLSLYSRVMMPGSLAPIVLALFGAQGCGKSLFQKKLCQIIIGKEEADAVQLNLDGDRIEFLRSITGHSVIAAVGELTGFSRGDLSKIKAFTTSQGDPMHHKFEGHFIQQRQWITMMDGNKYDGFQRDETGNRRFYPMFCGQLDDDEDGKPLWRPDFRATFDDPVRGISFEEDVWQIMAEAAAWIAENGERGYKAFVNEVVLQVEKFNRGEMTKGSGAIADPVVDTFFAKALAATAATWRKAGTATGLSCVDKKSEKVAVPQGVVIYVDDFTQAMDRVAGKQKVNSDRTRDRLLAFGEQNGAIVGKFTGNRRGLLFCVGEDDCWNGARPTAAIDALKTDDTYSGLQGDAAVNALKAKFAGDDWKKIAVVEEGY